MRAPRIALVITLLTAAVLASAAETPASPASAEALAREKLANAERLFNDGDYASARDAVASCIAEHESKAAKYPLEVITRLYVLDALVAYAFRDEGYAARVDMSLQRALDLDLDADIGDSAAVPPFVQERFSALRAGELALYARTTRRSAVGLADALILDPTVLENLSLLQVGVCYSYNLNDAFALDAEVRFPVQLTFWESIRGQLGVLWYPSFRVERISTAITFFYIFGLDEFTTYTHSLSLGGRVDFLTRSGFGIGGNAELVRADLVLGSSASASSPLSTNLDIGLARIVFSNITLYAYYAF